MNTLLDPTTIAFRAMTNADLAAVRALHALSFAMLAQAWHTPEQIAGHVAFINDGPYADELRRCHVEMALRGEEIIATAGWMAVPERPGTARIRKVFVHPTVARCGLGSRMVRRAEAGARRAGYGRMIVRANINAVPLYKKLGYTAVGEVKMDVGGGVELPAVMMEKPPEDETGGSITSFPLP